MTFVEKLLSINQRYVYLIVAVAVILPMVFEVKLPTITSPPVESLYKEIDSLAPDQKIILSLDYDPSTEPELHPMAEAIIRHCFKKKVQIFGMTMNLQGQNLGAEIFDRLGKEFNIPDDGSRYVFCGFRIGPVLLQIGEDIIEVFQTDFQGRDLRTLPMMQGVKNLQQFELCISLSGTSIGYSWINWPGTRYGKKIAVGVTGVLVPNFYPYLQSGQLVGMLPALKGAAEYEELLGEDKLRGKQGMGSQSAAHLLIILLIIVGNILYFIKKRHDEKMGR
ncbi:MAG: hypothetical protein Kow00107_01390 [Planctomycetota bacterium]